MLLYLSSSQASQIPLNWNCIGQGSKWHSHVYGQSRNHASSATRFKCRFPHNWPSDWYTSYLSHQKQRLLINDQSSDDFNWNAVSHKEAVWFLFCSLYVSRLYYIHVIANHLPSVHGYADDTVALSLDQYREWCSSKYHAQATIDLCSWCLCVAKSPATVINNSKTEFLIVASCQLSKTSINSISVRDSLIQSLYSVHTYFRFLGWF